MRRLSEPLAALLRLTPIRTDHEGHGIVMGNHGWDRQPSSPVVVSLRQGETVRTLPAAHPETAFAALRALLAHAPDEQRHGRAVGTWGLAADWKSPLSLVVRAQAAHTVLAHIVVLRPGRQYARTLTSWCGHQLDMAAVDYLDAVPDTICSTCLNPTPPQGQP